jgi:glucan phosphoethanolaminetransferase (alkaline phosphatase superfamily)
VPLHEPIAKPAAEPVGEPAAEPVAHPRGLAAEGFELNADSGIRRREGDGSAALRRAHARGLSLAELRHRLAPLLLVAPLVLVFVVDAVVRGDRLLALEPRYVVSYLGSLLESGALWALLLFTASAHRGVFRWFAAALFVLLATLSIGGQLYFHRQYATYLNLDATLFGTSLATSLFGQLKADGRNFLASVLPPLGASIAMVWASRALLPPARPSRVALARLLAPVAVLAVFLIPCSYRTVQASTPDVIYFHAIGGLVKQLTGVRTTAQVRPGLRTPPVMPRLEPAQPTPRNVILILTESVRADVVCSAPSESCPGAPRVNRELKGRLPLLQMRSCASTTAIELAVLWSGLEPVASREALHSAPLLFDYAHAAGMDSAYWTSHHMMFANSRLFVQDLPTTKQCGATDLDPLADIDLGGRDDLLTERVLRELSALKEPFFGVVHYGNTHVPYRVDPADAPFQPAIESKGPDDNEAYRNYYKNAVYLQDKTIADLVRFVRKSPVAARTVLVFTSDHGEAFREHGQLGHTGSILDEEIHVPFWIDAPEGTLTAAEEAAIRAKRDEPASHADVTPTVLDLLGLWREPALAPYKRAMVGASLLAPRAVAPALALTNCSGIWGCAFRNWGMMRGGLKLEGREWDSQWHCYDVLADPREEHDLGPAACGGLVPLAEQIHGGLPGASR